MPTFETSRSIDETAADWTARIDRGHLTAAEEAELEAWLQGDPRCRGALLRARAIALKSESARALGSHFDPADFVAPRSPGKKGFTRRRSMIWACSAAAGAALIAVGVSVPAAGTTISTARGERRLVSLKDGSTVTLNTDTSIRVRDDAIESHVAVLHGEAFFSVARGGTKPLIVEVDGRSLATAQAAFSIRKLDGGPASLLVRDGSVELAAPSWGDRRTIAVKSDMSVTLAGRQLFGSSLPERPAPISPATATRSLAWLDGKIAFEGETLQAATRSFARYSDVHIEISDPNLAKEPVTGLFAANDPVGFSRAVAAIFDARVEQRGGKIILSRTGK